MNYRNLRNRTAPLFLLTALIALAVPASLFAQAPAPPAARPAPPTPEAAAPIDLTGYWVSVVTEDWRYRMIVADKNDFASVPLNPAGVKLAGAWDPAADAAGDGKCKAFGAGGIMRIPGRVHISWADDKDLKVETDSGTQTRLFHFDTTEVPAGTTSSWQGYSIATWEGMPPRGGRNAPPPAKEGYLKVMTTDVKAGYLRTNGVPYSDKAVVEEYFDTFKETNGDQWLVVTTVVTDPTYLNRPFIVSTHFKKQADDKGWNPTVCRANEPR